MNAKLCLTSLILLAGCSSAPEKTVSANIPVPVLVPCKADIAKPGLCKPKDDSRQEWLRCELVNHERLKAYAAELEAVLKACQ